MRQLYMAAVVPTTDYAASTRYAPGRSGTKTHIGVMEKVERLASRLILRASKSVALLVLQSEARLPSVCDRLHQRSPDIWRRSRRWRPTTPCKGACHFSECRAGRSRVP